jgi:membrane protein YqaA with SNARE-associated domain
MHKVVLWIQGSLIPTLGPFGLMVVAFCDSSFLSIPEVNDILVVTSSAAHPGRAWLYVLLTTTGSLLGCLALREVGRRGGEALLVRRFGQQGVDRSRAAFKRWDLLALAVPSMLPPPVPFKIFVLSAGVFGFPLGRFLLTLAVARGLRYSFWGFMGAVYGDRGIALLRSVDSWFQAHGWAVVIVTLLVVAALVAIWVLRRRRLPPVGGAA